VHADESPGSGRTLVLRHFLFFFKIVFIFHGNNMSHRCDMSPQNAQIARDHSQPHEDHSCVVMRLRDMPDLDVRIFKYGSRVVHSLSYPRNLIQKNHGIVYRFTSISYGEVHLGSRDPNMSHGCDMLKS
jgi:hypothetical protein